MMEESDRPQHLKEVSAQVLVVVGIAFAIILGAISLTGLSFILLS